MRGTEIPLKYDVSNMIIFVLLFLAIQSILIKLAANLRIFTEKRLHTFKSHKN